MGIWEEPSLVNLVVPSDWEEQWRVGHALLVSVSGAGDIGVVSGSGDSRVVDGSSEIGPVGDDQGYELAWRSSEGIDFLPESHLFLGVRSGVALFAEMTKADGLVSLRDVVSALPESDVGTVMRAVALARYHGANGYCPACGAQTHAHHLGWSRICSSCHTEHFPRTDPAVIVAIVDDEDRILLAHDAGWEESRFSLIAGFAEAGESLEQTVHREVQEEVGIAVHTVTYAGSQPWPMPRSLMVGFFARTHGGDPLPDGEEITAARWFDRPGLRAAAENKEILLPMSASIAHRLVTEWFGQVGEAG